MRDCLWLPVLLITACSGPEIQFVPLPPSSDARSIIFVLRADGETQVAAFDASDGVERIDLPFRLASGQDANLEALLYRETLGALHVPQGILRRPEPDDVRRGLPEDPDSIFGTTLADGETTQWKERAEIELGAGFQFVPPTPCSVFEVNELRLGFVRTASKSAADDAVLLESGHVLVPVSSSERRLTIFDENGGYLLSGCDSRLSGGIPLGADRFWFGASDELQLVKIDEEKRTCTVERRVSTPDGGDPSLVAWMTGKVDSEGTAIFTLNRRGLFGFFDGESMTPLDRVEPNPEETFSDGQAGDGAIVSKSGGGFLAVYGATSFVYEGDENGLTRTEELPVPHFDQRLFTIARLSESRYAVGSGVGQVFVREGDGGWELSADLPDQASALAGLEGGWVAVAGRELVEYYDGFGECSPAFTVANSTRKGSRIVRTLEGDLVIPDWIGNQDTRPAAVVWAKRR